MRAILTALLTIALLVTTQWCSYANIPGPELSVLSANNGALRTANYADHDDDHFARQIPTPSSFAAVYPDLRVDLALFALISAHPGRLFCHTPLYALNRSLLI